MTSGGQGGSALVTGASRGIGAAIARALASDGWPVGVNYRSDRARADAVVQAIERDGGRAAAVAGDVSDLDAPDAVFGALQEAFGAPVLALVNNAGVNHDDLAPSLSDEQWSTVLEVNLNAAFRLTRRALKGMLRARAGRIVNISSVAGLRANPGQANYAAAKAGLIAFTKTVAVEVGRRGITANAVAPGLIETDMTTDVPKELLAAVPARRMGTPEEVAACVRFLVSAQASYVNGAVLTVDGGLAA